MKLLTIIGARPQFIKAAALSRTILSYFNEEITEYILHTGQHYDPNMSDIFFEELNIPKPHFHFNFNNTTTKEAHKQLVDEIRKVIQQLKPDMVLVYGDTNSTLAGAEAAHLEQVPLAHVEAGLRSYNDQMPEEHNRVQTDQWSQLLFAPTETAISNLTKEGIVTEEAVQNSQFPRLVVQCGDIMYDNSLYFAALSDSRKEILKELRVKDNHYVLATIHRNFNTDSMERLSAIFEALIEISNEIPVVLPLHPRTLKSIVNEFEEEMLDKMEEASNLIIAEPLSFLEMTYLEQHAKMIITDSGGVQKEAYFFEKPSIILRPETEWVEIVTTGAAILADADPKQIVQAYQYFSNHPPKKFPPIFGAGDSAQLILEELLRYFENEE